MEKDKIIALLAILAVVSVALNLYQYIAYQSGKVELSYSQSGAAGQGKTSTAGQAPLGSYAGTTGSTVFIGAVQSGGTTVILPKRTGSTAGLTVGTSISSYSPPEELEAIANAGSGNYATVMSGFNHGSAAVAGVTYPINVATSVTVGSYYYITLVTAMPILAFSPIGGSASGNAGGVIELMIPTNMAVGTGTLFSGTGITFTSGTEGTTSSVTVNAGAGTATALTNVKKY